MSQIPKIADIRKTSQYVADQIHEKDAIKLRQDLIGMIRVEASLGRSFVDLRAFNNSRPFTWVDYDGPAIQPTDPVWRKVMPDFLAEGYKLKTQYDANTDQEFTVLTWAEA